MPDTDDTIREGFTTNTRRAVHVHSGLRFKKVRKGEVVLGEGVVLYDWEVRVPGLDEPDPVGYLSALPAEVTWLTGGWYHPERFYWPGSGTTRLVSDPNDGYPIAAAFDAPATIGYTIFNVDFGRYFAYVEIEEVFVLFGPIAVRLTSVLGTTHITVVENLTWDGAVALYDTLYDTLGTLPGRQLVTCERTPTGGGIDDVNISFGLTAVPTLSVARTGSNKDTFGIWLPPGSQGLGYPANIMFAMFAAGLY